MTPLALAISMLLTIWTCPDGTPVYVEHARRSGGSAYVTELAREFRRASRRHGIGPRFLVALAYHESSLNQSAMHPVSGAWGIFQLHPQTRWSKRAERACAHSEAHCLAAQIEHGTRAVRFALDACDGSELRALSFHRFGECDRARERERVVMRLRDRLRAVSERTDA